MNRTGEWTRRGHLPWNLHTPTLQHHCYFKPVLLCYLLRNVTCHRTLELPKIPVKPLRDSLCMWVLSSRRRLTLHEPLNVSMLLKVQAEGCRINIQQTVRTSFFLQQFDETIQESNGSPLICSLHVLTIHFFCQVRRTRQTKTLQRASAECKRWDIRVRSQTIHHQQTPPAAVRSCPVWWIESKDRCTFSNIESD